MQYKLTSRREEAVTIDGLGVLPAATREGDTEETPGQIVPSEMFVDETQSEAFKLQRGLWPHQTHLPEGVESTILVGEVK